MTELIEAIRAALATEHEHRLLDAIGAARTEAEFAVAWCRWYFDDGGCP